MQGISILHVCGGDPTNIKAARNENMYSPRMWRWSQHQKTVSGKELVFSTYVEVILLWAASSSPVTRILHVCGGDPKACKLIRAPLQYSPRMWRWSSSKEVRKNLNKVFSTYVEVILLSSSFAVEHFCILHVCGGDPVGSTTKKISGMYSPRMWRWSSTNKTVESLSQVFSTYVEVILKN